MFARLQENSSLHSSEENNALLNMTTIIFYLAKLLFSQYPAWRFYAFKNSRVSGFA